MRKGIRLLMIVGFFEPFSLGGGLIMYGMGRAGGGLLAGILVE